MVFFNELACGATIGGASNTYHFALAFLCCFSASEWRTVVSAVSESFEIEFEEEAVLRILLHKMLKKKKKRNHILWINSLLN
jgi:hypothetical protein